MHDPNDRSFLGHPRGLGYIAFAEAWERFSYYGMQALLVLYMVHRLLLPGHVEHVAGFGVYHRVINSIYGNLSTQPLASAIFGHYTSLVYLTPIAGGLIADPLARTHADAFQIYILINGGVIAAPLIAGTLGEIYGWHWGFGAAGVGMLIGLTIYLLGRRYLPHDSPVVEEKEASPDHTAKTKLTRRDIIAIAVLIGLLPVLTIAVIPNQQIFNAYLVWAEAHVNLPVLPFYGKHANYLVDYARFDCLG